MGIAHSPGGISMRVLYIKTGKEPIVIDVLHKLEAFQSLVAGLIEVVDPFDDDVILVCNEEGRNLGLPINRIINERMDICGDFFLCGHDGTGLSDIPEDLIDKYRNVFSIKATDRTSQAWPMPT